MPKKKRNEWAKYNKNNPLPKPEHSMTLGIVTIWA